MTLCQYTPFNVGSFEGLLKGQDILWFVLEIGYVFEKEASALYSPF